MENTKLDSYDPLYDIIFNQYFHKNGDKLKPIQFLRSTIFKVNAFNGIESKYHITIDLNVDYVFSYMENEQKIPRQQLYCLGILE